MQQPASDFSIEALNRAPMDEAVGMLELVTERSPWLAQRLVAMRPYRDVDHLLERIVAEISALDHDAKLLLLRAHPELSPPAPQAMTAASQQEQGRLSLTNLNAESAARIDQLNTQYRQRHGYPFVIALHAYADMVSIIAQFESRLVAEPELEMQRALAEVASVARARLARLTGAANRAEAT